jgi:hypothetical protein
MMARLDRDMPDGISIPKSYSTVDDAAAKVAAIAAPTAYIPNQNVVTGRQPGPGDPGYEKFVADRLARQTTTRETGGGTTPPSEAPAGTHWSFIGGQWKLYKDAVSNDTSGADTIVSSVDNGDGTTTNTYKSGRKETLQTYNKGGASTNAATAAANLVAAQNQAAIDAEKKAGRQSAYNILYNEFDKYGLGSLVSDIKNYLIDNTFDPSEFSIQLQNTAAYQKRFAANADRIKAGLSALKPAEYIALEDQYQSLMRNYGLPESYSAKGDLGVQEGFNKLIANDVSATELEDRITTAQSRVVNADPNVLKALKAYYPDITNGDILAYTLDPKNAIDMIKRKVTAAEIGGTQMGAGLGYGQSAAEALAAAGVTQGQYAQAAPFISQAAERGTQLADIYGQGTYNQGSAEAEALNLAGGAQAAAKRKKLTGLETAAFSGSSGVGTLGRDKGIYGATQGQTGLY